MSLVRASAAIGSGTLASRILGFVSAGVLAATIGQQNPAANAYAVALGLPNSIYAIVAGGLLGAVIVPQIVRAAVHSDGGERFVNKLVTLAILVFVGVTLVATLCAPLLVRLYANGDGQLGGAGIALATAFAYWSLPQILFYAIYSLLGEILNARGVFGPFTWAPVLNNVVAIAVLVTFMSVFGGAPAFSDPSSWTGDKIALLAGGSTLGIAAQAIILIFFWRRAGLHFRPDFGWRGVGLGGAGRAAAWTFAMILVTQAAGVVQSQVATTPQGDDPSSATLRTAWLVFMLPHSLIAVSIGMPFYTRMSGHARDGDLDAVRADLSSSLRTIGLMITGSAAALAAAAIPFAAYFATNSDELRGITAVLLAYLIGLVPFSALFLVQRVFYALDDTRTPFFTQLIQSIVYVVGALLIATLPSEQIGISLAALSSVAATVQLIIAAVLLRRRIGGLGGSVVGRRFGVYALATIPAAGAGLAVLWGLGGLGAPGPTGLGLIGSGFAVAGPIPALLSVAAVGAAALIVYVGVLAVARVPEVTSVTGQLRSILTRR